jgi:hypothetical protein
MPLAGNPYASVDFTTDDKLPELPAEVASVFAGLKLRVVVRSGPGLSAAAQAIHAVTAWEQEAPATAAAWRKHSNTVAVLQTADMEFLMLQAAANGVGFTPFYEVGHSIPTALVLDPLRTKTAILTRKLPLV